MSISLNKLEHETSPYLLQHADNPVNWYPWAAEALNTARQQNKPILLSIGYSACHWCHVMAHESFEDETTAALMNQYFINIKVDREERPDLDKIYQLAHQLMTGRSGGWPLTVVLSPKDQIPFFAGTYFPVESQRGMRSFTEILHAIQQAWTDKQAEIHRQNTAVRSNLKQFSKFINSHDKLDASLFENTDRQLMSFFDPTYGGFSPTPKFPHPYSIERTFRQPYYYPQQYKKLREAGLFTARKIAQGGIFDHLGGGFCRYSTDKLWMIPHFEKMLYDNGQLMTLFCQAYKINADYYFEQAVNLSAHWIMREMQSPEGGYYSAQDADSEGVEGKYYSWTKDEIINLLNFDEYSTFSKTFGLDRKANFAGKWYPHIYQDIEQLSQQKNQSVADIKSLLTASKHKLLTQRQSRVPPATDDKILTSWNALMICGMYSAARTFNQAEYARSATRALSYIRQKHWKQKRLLATSKNGKVHLNAYLDDYAYLILAIINALQNQWDNTLYQWAIEITDSMLELFEDNKSGGFFFTSFDHESLPVRCKTFSDDAMPSGNGIAAQGLQYLGLLSGNNRYLESAEKTLLAASSELNRNPILYSSLVNALDVYLNPATIIIIRGPVQSMADWQQVIFQHYLPDILCFAIPEQLTPPAELKHKVPVIDGVCAYICHGFNCQPPVTNLYDFQQSVSKLIAVS